MKKNITFFLIFLLAGHVGSAHAMLRNLARPTKKLFGKVVRTECIDDFARIKVLKVPHQGFNSTACRAHALKSSLDVINQLLLNNKSIDELVKRKMTREYLDLCVYHGDLQSKEDYLVALIENLNVGNATSVIKIPEPDLMMCKKNNTHKNYKKFQKKLSKLAHNKNTTQALCASSMGTHWMAIVPHKKDDFVTYYVADSYYGHHELELSLPRKLHEMVLTHKAKKA